MTKFVACGANAALRLVQHKIGIFVDERDFSAVDGNGVVVFVDLEAERRYGFVVDFHAAFFDKFVRAATRRNARARNIFIDAHITIP